LGKLELRQTESEKAGLRSPPVVEQKPFILDKAGPNDFFRLRRKASGWIVEMVRVVGDKVVLRTDVYAEDRLEQTERRLLGYAADAERDR
jgi:hypothetical protein